MQWIVLGQSYTRCSRVASMTSLFSKEKREYLHQVFVKGISAALAVENTHSLRQYESDCKYFSVTWIFFFSYGSVKLEDTGMIKCLPTEYSQILGKRKRETNSIKADVVTYLVEIGRQLFHVETNNYSLSIRWIKMISDGVFSRCMRTNFAA